MKYCFFWYFRDKLITILLIIVVAFVYFELSNLYLYGKENNSDNFEDKDSNIGTYNFPIKTALRYCNSSSSASINSGRVGICGLKEFDRKWLPYLEKLGLTDQQTSKINQTDDVNTMKLTPKFVTAFSDNHFEDALKTVLGGFKKHLPDEKLIVYDLGLTEIQTKELRNDSQISGIRPMNFSEYPKHVKNLLRYHWKPLLIAEFLQEHNAIFYMDAHITWNTGNLAQMRKQLSCNFENPNHCAQYPMTFMWGTGHSIFATTKSTLYDYFPINETIAKSIEMGSAGFQLTYGTSDVRRNIYKCDPKTSCTWGPNQFDYYAKCHRYDQSVFNILLANRHEYNRSRYFINFNTDPKHAGYKQMKPEDMEYKKFWSQ